MTRKIVLAPMVVLGLSLGGCLNAGPANRSLDSIHQPVVRSSNLTYDVDVSSGNMTPSEMTRLASWLDALEVSYGDRVAIDETGGYVSAPARQQVANLLGRKGMILAERAPITAGEILPGRMRIVVTRSSAAVPSCPDWRTVSSSDMNSGTTSNYGCATNSNLAAMVANPTDLVRGQSRQSNDPLTASRAINSYRNAKPTGEGGLPQGSTSDSGGGSSGGGQ